MVLSRYGPHFLCIAFSSLNKLYSKSHFWHIILWCTLLLNKQRMISAVIRNVNNVDSTCCVISLVEHQIPISEHRAFTCVFCHWLQSLQTNNACNKTNCVSNWGRLMFLLWKWWMLFPIILFFLFSFDKNSNSIKLTEPIIFFPPNLDKIFVVFFSQEELSDCLDCFKDKKILK